MTEMARPRKPIRLISRLLISATLILGASSLAQHASAEDVAPAVTQADPAKPATTDSLWAETFKDLTDAPVKLDTYKGKVVAVYFWATWCVPCRQETPKLVKLYDRLKNKDVMIIGIALDSGDKVRAFAQKYGIDYPVVYGGPNGTQIGRDLGNDVGGIPFTVIIGKDGKIVQTIKGDAPDGVLEGILIPLAG
jgi:thiol-disulfide isomerase/thioredoxin